VGEQSEEGSERAKTMRSAIKVQKFSCCFRGGDPRGLYLSTRRGEGGLGRRRWISDLRHVRNEGVLVKRASAVKAGEYSDV